MSPSSTGPGIVQLAMPVGVQRNCEAQLVQLPWSPRDERLLERRWRNLSVHQVWWLWTYLRCQGDTLAITSNRFPTHIKNNGTFPKLADHTSSDHTYNCELYVCSLISVRNSLLLPVVAVVPKQVKVILALINSWLIDGACAPRRLVSYSGAPPSQPACGFKHFSHPTWDEKPLW